MEKKFLKKHENKVVNLILKNSFIYSNVLYKLNSDGLLEFTDRNGQHIVVDADFVSMIISEDNDG